MFAELCIELDSKEINYKYSSKFQGVMMEYIDTNYAESLHRNQLNPYSQFVFREREKSFWYIRTLTKEAYEKIVLPLAKIEKLTMKNGMEVRILSRTIKIWNEEILLKEFYEEKCEQYLKVEFNTPTSFKRDGKYVIYPDLKLIYGSLMRKYTAISSKLDMIDEETLSELIEQSEIIRYRLQSAVFPVGNIKINGFTGMVTIRINGPETMARYVRMLLEFGKFSGVGIKTSMGMGAMKYIKE